MTIRPAIEVAREFLGRLENGTIYTLVDFPPVLTDADEIDAYCLAALITAERERVREAAAQVVDEVRDYWAAVHNTDKEIAARHIAKRIRAMPLGGQNE